MRRWRGNCFFPDKQLLVTIILPYIYISLNISGVAFTSHMLMPPGKCLRTLGFTGCRLLANQIFTRRPRFEDMLHLYRNCDAVECKSTKGRDFSKPGTDLELVSFNNCATEDLKDIHR